MSFSRPREPYEHWNTERFNVSGDDKSTVGYVDFTKEFKYLGSLITPSLTSDADVTKRLKAASAAFGALRGVFRNRHLD